MESMDYGTLPERESFIAKVDTECPNGYPMKIVDPKEWAAIAEIVNRGIDSHLEAVFCDADPTTGEIVFNSGASLYTFMRRIVEDPPQCGENGCTDDCYNESEAGEHCDISRVTDLVSSILFTLDYEWV